MSNINDGISKSGRDYSKIIWRGITSLAIIFAFGSLLLWSAPEWAKKRTGLP